MSLQPQEFIAKAMAAVLQPTDQLKLSMSAEFLRARGFLRLKVAGRSMLPTMWPGDVLTIESRRPGDLTVGDIGLFEHRARFFIHRIQRLLILNGSLHFVTRGDSASHDDPPFPPESLLGKVVQIEHGKKTFVPVNHPSSRIQCLGWIFCHCDHLRNLALSVHSRQLRLREAELLLSQKPT
jgi:signal peptidase I